MTPTIEIYGTIGVDVSAAQVIQSLYGQGDVMVRIHSGGGHVFDALAIYNRLRQHSGKVTVVIDGLAASAASLIAMAGDHIVMHENAQMMVHLPWLSTTGDSDELHKAAEHLERIREPMLRAYSMRTGMEPSAVLAMLKAETWMSAEEAQQLGFADEVTSSDAAQDWHAAALIYTSHVTAGLPTYDIPAMEVIAVETPSNLSPEGDATQESIMAQEELDALLERVKVLEDALTEMRGRAETAEATLEQERVEQAEAMAKLEDDKTRVELAQAGITEGVDRLVKLKRTDAELFAHVVQMAARPVASGVQAPIGKVGISEVSGEPTAAEVIEMAQAEGFTYGKGLIRWVAKNYPQLVDEVQAVARD